MRKVNIDFTPKAIEFFKDMTDEEATNLVLDKFFLEIDQHIDAVMLGRLAINSGGIYTEDGDRSIALEIDNNCSVIRKDGLLMFFGLGCIVDIKENKGICDILYLRMRTYDELDTMLYDNRDLCEYLNLNEKKVQEEDSDNCIQILSNNIGTSMFLGKVPGYPYSIITKDYGEDMAYIITTTTSYDEIVNNLENYIHLNDYVDEDGNKEYLIIPSPILNPYTYVMKDLNMEQPRDNKELGEQIIQHATAVAKNDIINDEGE